ncbi:MAG: hypothetical protein IPJ79_20395 [Bacteroidetes bacterium]|nr:hypothetical protein [Bacteroidota bacterium]
MEQSASYNTTNLFKIIVKWRKSILLVALMAAVVAFIATLPFFIPPKFKSSAVVYPVNLESYSIESQTEQLQQLVKSDDIKEELIKDFDLYKHYDIDSTGKTARYYVMLDLTSNIKVSKTDFESVEIEVYDTNPLQAKRMVDSIIVKANRVHKTIYRQRQNEAMQTAQFMYNLKKKEVDSLDIALKELRLNSGIFDLAQQTKGFSESYYNAVINGKAGKGNNGIDMVHDNFKRFSGDYVMLNEMLTRARLVLFDYKQYYENAFKDVNKEFSVTNVVTNPIVADKKSYPIRWLILLATVASVSVMYFIGLIIYENTRAKKTH